MARLLVAFFRTSAWYARQRSRAVAGTLSLLVGATAYTACSASDDSTRRAIVFLGDSITAGDGVPPEVTFSHRLGVALGIAVRNAGISGDTTTGALRRLDGDVLVHRPRVVVVELGMNDEVDYHRPARETLGTLQRIARRLRQKDIAVVLVYTPFGDFDHAVYREGFRDIARRERARLVEDFYDGIVPALTVDGLHPTAEGHALLARRLEPILRELLRG
jgi:acyl-CoA thioesterase-1